MEFNCTPLIDDLLVTAYEVMLLHMRSLIWLVFYGTMLCCLLIVRLSWLN